MKIISRDNSSYIWIQRILDFLLPIVTLAIIINFSTTDWQERYTILGLLGGLIFMSAAQMVGIYHSWRGRSLFTSTQLVLKAWILTWMILIVLLFLYKDSANFSRLNTTIWAVVTPFVLISYRVAIHALLSKYRKSTNNFRSIAVAGAGVVGRELAKTINTNPWLGLKVSCFYDDNKALHQTEIDNIPVIADLEQMTTDAYNNKFDEVYLCLPLKAETKIKSILNKLTDTTAIVKYIPDLFSFDLMHAKWTDLKGIPVISVYDSPLNSQTAKFVKRLEDIIFASLILTLISPVLLVLAILVKTTSKGPVIFKQKRYGLNGAEIEVYKFRSMTVQDNGSVVKQATKNDVRITPLGRFIRKTSLDELPQFINVLQGRMSIVGPRPHASAHNEEYRTIVPKYMQRHIVKPGITGWAQVNGWRGETDTLDKMEKRIEYDLNYINNWTLWFDIKIIFLTVLKGFISKNAY